MKLALVLFRYFPYGGLQRDFMRVAELCIQRGHQVVVLVAEWEGQKPQDMEIHELHVNGLGNHAQVASFASAVRTWHDSHDCDLLVAFNRLPGADLYFAADSCFAEHLETKPGAARYLPRYRTFLRLEQQVFAATSRTRILFLNGAQRDAYLRYYPLAEHRYAVLPPGVSRDRQPGPDAAQARQAVRTEFAIGENELLVLFLGSGFRIKGLDRVLLAMAALPRDLASRTHLLVVGDDDNPAYQTQARSLGIHRLTFAGGRSDVPALLQAADVLLHPAYRESAGMVLAEALVAGLPVLTTDTCGYAGLIEEAGAGRVVPSPFEQAELNKSLTEMLDGNRDSLRQAALDYAGRVDLFAMHEQVVNEIEALGEAR